MLRDNADRLGEQRKMSLRCGLESCTTTLRSLEKLMGRFTKLGASNSIPIWKRIQWTIYQGPIEGYRARIMAHTCTLSLAMSTIGRFVSIFAVRTSRANLNSSIVLDIQERIENALNQTPEHPEPQASGLNTPHSSDTDSVLVSLSDLKVMERIDSNTTLVDPLAGSSGSSSDDSYPKVPLSGPASLRAHRIDGEASLVEVVLQDDSSDILSVVDDAQRALSSCCNEQNSRRPRSPPLIDPPHPEYVVDIATAQRFQTSASSQQNWGSVTVDKWLQNAAWWLLKVLSDTNDCMFSGY
jgi:hypothetical protein